MKTTFTILHTNDMHSNFIGMAPSSDYTPLMVNEDQTTGGYARIAAVIAARKKARESQGPVLILDAGDFSMGTPFAAASREIGPSGSVGSRASPYVSLFPAGRSPMSAESYAKMTGHIWLPEATMLRAVMLR